MKWLRSLFAWRLVRDTGKHRYWENTVTGKRTFTVVNIGGYQPIDDEWLLNGRK